MIVNIIVVVVVVVVVAITDSSNNLNVLNDDKKNSFTSFTHRALLQNLCNLVSSLCEFAVYSIIVFFHNVRM